MVEIVLLQRVLVGRIVLMTCRKQVPLCAAHILPREMQEGL